MLSGMNEPAAVPLELDAAQRERLWRDVGRAIESYLGEIADLPVAPSADPSVPRRLLQAIDFESPMPVADALALVFEGLRHQQVHNGHPRYFGLFNPATATMSVAADALVAAFNPQLAAWTHAPFACEVERLVLRSLGLRLGYDPAEVSGSFTSGGAEANHTALVAALVQRFPDFAEEGARALPGSPVLYVSSESHHSFVKAARVSGIGASAVREVPVDENFVMDPKELEDQVVKDRAAGRVPFFIVATLGTTGAGLIDPVGAIADVGARQGLWVHADAAWGGAAALLPELRKHFEGLEKADSITFDAHKWLSVPMAAGMFFTRHGDVLERTFSVSAAYMPKAALGTVVTEPHRTSMQWTRRFIGLKLFLPLLVSGFPGYERTIRRMVELGDELRARLEGAGFPVLNRTPLPVVCFRDGRHPEGGSLERLRAIADSVAASGRAWISVTSLGGKLPALRACISNFRTESADLDALVEILGNARAKLI
jgi:glutamate/tyrosine decarboxylase-like PLP-dependent enzyme